ncbi:TnpV protein [Congzhengia minquanensis]|uniref:TnpV protein n=1 Tax=Congzhengia minquanensis TaxID=2763657 RepID=A0A926DMT7_9FIRM|nr:TnpV protein [Congzhengia minquanensis]
MHENQRLLYPLISLNPNHKNTFIKELVAKQYIIEELKANDQFAWISTMEQFKHTAEEIMLNEYAYKVLK